MRACLLAVAALSLTAAPAWAADEDSALTARSRLKISRVFTGAEGKSQAETLALDAVASAFGGTRFFEARATRVTLGAWPDKLRLDFHVANNRTLLLALSGVLVIDLGDGESFRLAPGQMALAEDRTGRGHVSACENPTGSRQCMVMQINLDNSDAGLGPTPRTPSP